MSTSTVDNSWFDPRIERVPEESYEDSHEMVRQWQGFMTARLLLGLVLFVLQSSLYVTGTSHSQTLVAICAAYFASTVASKLLVRPRPLGQSFNLVWGALVGVDLLAFSALQLLQDGNGVNYTPLFALPILLASVLGSLRLALGTAAGITVLLLSGALWSYLKSSGDVTSYFAQSALSGMGYFAIALLSNQLSTRLANEGQRARKSHLAAAIQRQVNELVIESLSDGVLIVDGWGCVRAANPAARQLLGSHRALHAAVFDLRDEDGWYPLLHLTHMSTETGHSHEENVTISHGDQGPMRLHVRTRLAAPRGATGDKLCVLFLQDQREVEARLRTEKLAGMGRLSTAVAHEIRNPLAAIAQANALLDEDIEDPALKKLTLMVSQNTKRLEKIVNDILNVARVQPQDQARPTSTVELGPVAQRICSDWAAQSACRQRLNVQLADIHVPVRFDPEHLRRILVNLLDNACRYASDQANAIQVHARMVDKEHATLSVWSDGAPMDQSVERHLFEPFFSSDSRSSGLGLYICRELCEGHDATIIYQRNFRKTHGKSIEGNEFVITFKRSPPHGISPTADRVATPWHMHPN